ncbi:DUF2142 domain-containing protein [Bifidobacterium callitrichos]|uniref:DUF2142 domain-containing protein n=1 Tax=Bifidobacterium callitrichos TaxID=762209 RepID=A0A5M9ZCU3_9BIFI|nr:DUF2142 domain-containing protein [Bifidobacterium callitrichos]KAA8816510.1 DUF2142 domain-containing protein [Bifidobacterium callitrichos]
MTDTPRATQYPLFGYIPQAIGLKIGLMLRLSPYVSMQLARLSNYLVCLTLFVISILLLPRAKMVMVVIAATPTVCFISSSVMLDGLMVALSAVITSFALHAANSDRSMTTGMFIGVIIIAALLCYIKAIYLVPLLLVFVLPEHVLSIKRKMCASLSLAIAFLSYILWSQKYSSMGYLANYSDNVSYVLQNPLRFIVCIIINVVADWRDLIPNDPSTIIIIAILVVMSMRPLLDMRYIDSVFHSKSVFTVVLNHRYLIVSVVGVLLAWFLVYAFEALTWNDLPSIGAYGHLEGVQGRYILPLLPLLTVSGLYDRGCEDQTVVSGLSDQVIDNK